jgi:hypothetical protein
MNRLIWGLAVAGVAFWSLFSWGTYALVTGGSEWISANTGLLGLQAEAQYWLQWSLRLVEQFGVVLLWIVWGFGTVAVLAGAWVTTRLAGAARRYTSAAPRA